MLYFVHSEWIEDPSETGEEAAAMWEKIVRPSLKTIAEMVDGKKTGGVFVGQRAGVCVIDAQSHEELGKTLASLPFWGHVKWNVMPLESWSSAIQRDSSAFASLKGTSK
jgi:muconolactone delta-isomerase